MPQLRRPPGRGRTVTGLDIEPGVVRAVEVRMDNGQVVVERAASAPLEPTVVRDGEVVEPDALAAVLRDLFAEHKFDKRVRIGVANQRVVVRSLLLPPISDDKQLATAVRFLAAEELPMPLDQAVLDHVVLGPVDTPEGPRVRVLVVAARRSMIDGLLAAAKGAGLRPEGIDLAAFAMVRALGAGTTGATLHLSVSGIVNLAVTRDGECVFTRVVGGGLEAMATDLAERQMISVDAARAALREVVLEPPAPRVERAAEPEPEPEPELEPELAEASAADDEPVFFVPVLAEEPVAPEPAEEPVAAPVAAEDPVTADARSIMAEGVRRIAGEVRNSIDFHLGSAADAPTVERVLLTGPALGVSGFADELARRLSLAVETADVPGGEQERGAFAVAAGLAVEQVAA